MALRAVIDVPFEQLDLNAIPLEIDNAETMLLRRWKLLPKIQIAEALPGHLDIGRESLHGTNWAT